MGGDKKRRRKEVKGEKGAGGGGKAEGLKAQSLTPGPGRGCTCPGTPHALCLRGTRGSSHSASLPCHLCLSTRVCSVLVLLKSIVAFTHQVASKDRPPHTLSLRVSKASGENKQTSKQKKTYVILQILRKENQLFVGHSLVYFP